MSSTYLNCKSICCCRTELSAVQAIHCCLCYRDVGRTDDYVTFEAYMCQSHNIHPDRQASRPRCVQEIKMNKWVTSLI